MTAVFTQIVDIRNTVFSFCLSTAINKLKERDCPACSWKYLSRWITFVNLDDVVYIFRLVIV